jgi:hypothetical protein
METSLSAFLGHRPDRHIEIKSKQVRPGQVFVYHVPFHTLTAAGDVVNNLRGALDHLVAQLSFARFPNLTQRQLRTCQFPIYQSPSRYEDGRKRDVQFIRSGAARLIDSLKPYKGGNDALWILSQLDNTSKHRILLSVGKTVMCHADWVGEMSGFPVFMYKLGNPQFSGIYARPKMKQNRVIAREETLRKLRISKREALLPTLHYLVDAVDGLIGQFLPYLG